MFKSELLARVVTLVMAFLWLRVDDFAAHKGWISSEPIRKIIHIATGPIFVLCWLLFNNSPVTPFIVGIAPLGITAQFAMVGTGLIKDPSAVDAMSPTGERREILCGPLCYGIVFVLLTIIFGLNTPVGVIALMVLCGGDGLADVVGKRIKTGCSDCVGVCWAGIFSWADHSLLVTDWNNRNRHDTGGISAFCRYGQPHRAPGVSADEVVVTLEKERRFGTGHH